MGLYADNGEENGNHYNVLYKGYTRVILGLYWGHLRVIQEIYWDNGKLNGNSYLGFWVLGPGFRKGFRAWKTE